MAKPTVKREQVLGQYLRGEIPRAQAIERVGIAWVLLVERQYAAVAEDLAWARGGTPARSLTRTTSRP